MEDLNILLWFFLLSYGGVIKLFKIILKLTYNNFSPFILMIYYLFIFFSSNYVILIAIFYIYL